MVSGEAKFQVGQSSSPGRVPTRAEFQASIVSGGAKFHPRQSFSRGRVPGGVEFYALSMVSEEAKLQLR